MRKEDTIGVSGPWYPLDRLLRGRVSMYAVVEPFLEVCLLRRGPQDLPPSGLLLGLALVAYYLVSALTAMAVYGPGVGLLQAGVEVITLAGYTYAGLQVAGRLARFWQTLIALAGTGTVIGLVMVPLVYVLYPEASGNLAAVASMVYLLLVGWLLAVFGHIFRHALSFGHLGWGVLVALGYLVVSSVVLQGLFPMPQQGG